MQFMEIKGKYYIGIAKGYIEMGIIIKKFFLQEKLHVRFILTNKMIFIFKKIFLSKRIQVNV